LPSLFSDYQSWISCFFWSKRRTIQLTVMLAHRGSVRSRKIWRTDWHGSACMILAREH
jgi:hypothetical protein